MDAVCGTLFKMASRQVESLASHFFMLDISQNRFESVFTYQSNSKWNEVGKRRMSFAADFLIDLAIPKPGIYFFRYLKIVLGSQLINAYERVIADKTNRNGDYFHGRNNDGDATSVLICIAKMSFISVC